MAESTRKFALFFLVNERRGGRQDNAEDSQRGEHQKKGKTFGPQGRPEGGANKEERHIAGGLNCFCGIELGKRRFPGTSEGVVIGA